MKRELMEVNFKKLVENEITRQLQEVFGGQVGFKWTESIWSKAPKIEVKGKEYKVIIKEGNVIIARIDR